MALLLGTAAVMCGLAALFRREQKKLRIGLIVLSLVFTVAALAVGVGSSLSRSTEPTGSATSPSARPPSTPPSMPPPIVATDVRQLNVVGDSGQLGDDYNVEATASGACSDGSQVLYDNPNAYRCSFGDSSLADPCLALADGESVFCVRSPWALSGVQIFLEEPVSFDPTFVDPSVVAGDNLYPWALEVVDPRESGQYWQCRALSGAGYEISGMRATWGCKRSDGSGEATALNSIIVIDGDPLWKVWFYEEGQPEAIRANVVKVWH
ncbi:MULTISPECIES: hypothetical protein [unclassified Microbacterium]|uniref:hypothetical protein n=1 Tax=unclassified Microbacterium TaxID=2609290 RepID=UPI003018C751